LNQNTGTVFVDSSGNFYSANTNGQGSWSTDSKVGSGAFYFSNSSCATTSRVVQDEFSFTLWIKTSQNFESNSTVHWENGAAVIDCSSQSDFDDFGSSIQDGRWTFGTGDPDTIIQSPGKINGTDF
jgi:hypothetical protein